MNSQGTVARTVKIYVKLLPVSCLLSLSSLQHVEEPLADNHKRGTYCRGNWPRELQSIIYCLLLFW